MDPCGLVDKFRDLVLNLIWEQLLYLIYYHRNIDQLSGQLTDLTLGRSSIQHQIDEAKNNGEQIEETVLQWLGEVDELSKQVQKFHEESQAKRVCSITSCPNPWLRYKLSKRAKAMIEEGAKIFAKRNLGRIGYLPPLPSNLELTNTKGNEWIDLRVPIMNQILEELRNPGVHMIGLCGLGGVGKTTIATEVAKNQKIFEKVIMATVSQELNIEKIQGQIAEKLNMHLKENDKAARAFRLCERLKEEKNMLLILDDLWEELDLGKVGIPFVSVENDSKKNEGCKLLLTSRKKELLSDLMKCQRIVEVGVLSGDEALELFKKTAELSTDSSSPELISRATDIVQKCGGLPLAIATVAKTLRNKDLNEFEDALARLNNPLRRNNTLTREVNPILKLSYDHLGSSEYRHVLLLAAMLSHDPSIEDLIMYSVGLDYLDGIQSMEEAHTGISTAVRKLKSSNLFLDSISSHHVTIHDVFRDVAWLIAFHELHAFIRRRLREWPDENMLRGCEGICLQESDISDLPEELHGPRLMFFLLNSTKRDLNIPSMFFKSSEELKVLAFTNVHFSSLPSLSFLQRLKALCLHSCLLEDITEIRSLKKLKVLSLAYSEIERLPIELAELTSLQMLNLSHCSNLKEIPQKLLSSLKKLEVLYMGNSFHQWKVEGSSKPNENASLDELKDLPISSLNIQIANVSMLPENLFLKMNLRRYKIFIGKRWIWQGDYRTSKILKLELESSIDLTARLRNLSKGVEDLHLYGSNGQENVLYNLDASGFPCLRHLRIKSNDDIKYIVLNSAYHEDAFLVLESLELKNLKALENLCEGPNDIVFGQLHTLKMQNLPALIGDFSIKDRATNNPPNKIFKSLFNKKMLLPKLEILELSNLHSSIALIWDDQLSHNSFSNLKILMVEGCGFMKLMPVHVLKYLNNLEELEVKNCYKLENMFDFEYLNYNEDMASSAVIVPLKKLVLRNLPKLKNVCSNNCQGNGHAVTADLCIKDGTTNKASNEISKSLFNKVLFPKLEILELSNLDSSIALIWDDQLLHNSFRNLKTLMVYGCGFMTLMPGHVLKYLNNLEELEVRYCNMLDIVFDFEDLKDDKEMESSSVVVQMKKLKLWNLPKLKNLWSNHHQGNVSFPSLRSIEVFKCESLTSIFPASIAKGMLCGLEELEIRQCGVDVIVAKDQVLESAAVTIEFPSLTSLHLSDLQELGNFYPHQHTLKFPHLHRLSIGQCDELEIFEKEISSSSEIHEEECTLNLKYPLFSHHDEVIQKLEELILWGREAEMIGSGQFPMYHFPNVKLLSLAAKEATTISYRSLLKSFTKLEDLQLRGNFEKAFGGEDVARFPKLTLSNNSIMRCLSPALVSSPNLTHLNVNWCGEWTTLMTSSIARSLVHLTHLSVNGCYEMEEIITKQEGEDDVDKEIFFKKLESLELTQLPRLRRFCRHNYTFRFPLLDKLVIKKCPKFKEFSPGLIDTPSLRSVQLSQDFWGEHHEILDTNLSKTFYQQRYVTSRELVLDEDDAIMIMNDKFPTDRCPQVEILGIEGFIDEWVTFPYTLLERFPKLNALHVENCSFEEIFPSHAPSSTSFHNLTALKVSKCHHLVYLVTCSAVKSLVNLETLEIDECEKLEEIVRNETDEDVERGTTFSNLKTLIVKSCDFMKLVPFHVLKSLNNLEKLEVSNCDKLEMVFGFEDLNDYHKEMESSSVVAPLSLTHLEVNGCDGLTTLMTSSAAASLVHITRLSISKCDQIEEIITKQEREDNEDKEIFFNQMKFMELGGLPRLKRFCGYNYTFLFPLLEHVNIRECPQLTMFCPGAIHAPRLHSVRVGNMLSNKDILTTNLSNTIQHLFTFEEVISTTWSMALNGKNIRTVMDVFPQVMTLYVESFKDEGVTFPYSCLERFPLLYRLYVEHSSFEEIFPSQDEIIDFMGKISPHKELYITYMDKLKSIWKDDSQLPSIHQNLNVLEVKSCCSLVKLAPSSTSFKDLIKLSLSGCHQLIHLVTTSTAKSLLSLKRLTINDCRKMEEIVKNDTNEDVQGGITFNQLAKIKLTDMPSLKMFSSQSHTFKFPILEKIKIIGCPEMKMFCQGVLETPKLSKVKIEEHDMEWKDEGDVNKTMEGLSLVKDSFNI